MPFSLTFDDPQFATLGKQILPAESRDPAVPPGFSRENMIINMGPHHPSTHGVLRLLVELDGETVVNLAPDIGFLHTGIEKNMEAKRYVKALVMVLPADTLPVTVKSNPAYHVWPWAMATPKGKVTSCLEPLPEVVEIVPLLTCTNDPVPVLGGSHTPLVRASTTDLVSFTAEMWLL